MLIAFHKPYGVLSQFTDDGSRHRTLADFGFPPRVYSLGRLDAESEGLLLLSDEPDLNHALLDPRQAHERTYWAQVERIPSSGALQSLARGLVIGGRRTLPCQAVWLDPQPTVPPRDPPIRVRKNVPDGWLELTLIEGKNHQVRKMTAAIGHPTLRLIRVQIGDFPLENISVGQWRELTVMERKQVFASTTAAARHR
jgi:23S rRNA pseudouridine2457 synthase